MTEASTQVGTAAATWKSFCRLVEDPASRKFFRLATPELVAKAAVFEVAADQRAEALAWRPAADVPPDESHDVVPPFPFPVLAIVYPGGVVVAMEPELSEDEAEFSCRMVAYTANPSRNSLGEAQLSVSATAAPTQGPRGVLKDLQFRYYDAPGDVSVEIPTTLDRAVRRVAEVEQRLATRNPGGAPLGDLANRFREASAWLNANLVEIDGLTRSIIPLEFEVSLHLLNWLSSPGNYVVRRHPAQPRARSQGSIQRLGERTTHVIMRRDRIVSEWHGVHGSSAKMPHLRRGHYRQLRAEFFKNTRGKFVWVRPSRIGGDQVRWTQAGRHYVVVG